MADVQLENGYTRIANELLDAILRAPFSKREIKVMLGIIRQTYGYGKKTDDITITRLATIIGIKRQHVSVALDSLVTQNAVLKRDGRYGYVVEIQKNHVLWSPSQNRTPRPKTGRPDSGRPETGRKVSRIGSSDRPETGHTIDNLTKDNPKKKKDPHSPPLTRRTDRSGEARLIFEHWQTVHNHGRAKLDDKRRRVIRARLKDGYSAPDLCRAIDGCRNSPHHMGQNEAGTVYDALTLILRNADQVDKFIAMADSPPIPQDKSNGQISAVEQVARANAIHEQNLHPESESPPCMAAAGGNVREPIDVEFRVVGAPDVVGRDR